jgi:hypothetical protein
MSFQFFETKGSQPEIRELTKALKKELDKKDG